MKIVRTSERAPVLADASTLEQLNEGHDIRAQNLGHERARGREGNHGAVVIDGSRLGRDAIELNECVEISQEAFVIQEARHFLVEAMTTRDDRLALFAHRVLIWAVERESPRPNLP